MKRFCALLLCAVLLCMALPWQTRAAEMDVNAKSALLMDAATGTVLFEKNAHEALAPASVTKIMTMLLIMEAIDSGSIGYDDMVTASESAAAKGGSQVYLKAGEQMAVSEMLKSIAVSSANDCACAMAEHLSGSEGAFVDRMNQRARELGMEDTHFVNCTGLPAEGHVTSAWDIAVMSRELIRRHPDIRRFTTIWMDTLRDGQFQLSNTNKLIRFYEGATGLKTGSTDSARYCISATAEREGMELIAVVMKGETADKRNADAKALLNYGFANFTPYTPDLSAALAPLPVRMGKSETVAVQAEEVPPVVVAKEKLEGVQTEIHLPESVEAPVEAGQELGTAEVCDGENVLFALRLTAAEAVERLHFQDLFRAFLRVALMKEG